MTHQPTMDDFMGYAEVLWALENILIETATEVWQKQPIQSKSATGLGTESNLLAKANIERRQAYSELTGNLNKLQAKVNNNLWYCPRPTNFST